MNPWVRNMQKASKIKIYIYIYINFWNVHVIGLYCIIMSQCTVQNTKKFTFFRMLPKWQVQTGFKQLHFSNY